jgi:hypothetical protein
MVCQDGRDRQFPFLVEGQHVVVQDGQLTLGQHASVGEAEGEETEDIP